MGMFDSFLMKEMKCPKGHKQPDGELQTKALLNLMLEFKQGEKVRIDVLDADFIIGRGRIVCHLYCDDCDKSYDYYAKIENGIFSGVRKKIITKICGKPRRWKYGPYVCTYKPNHKGKCE